ncbi:MAG TPA: GNAT family N-acetyltransferase [Candidatus Limnocylindrales bacterium]
MTWQPMSLAIETERLTLRLRDERDAAWYRELIGERGEALPTLEEARLRLARFRDLTIEIGIGALAIRRRAEGDVIGYCALVVGRASLDEPEIAYELLRRFHGHGYATEAARALVDAAAATGRQRLWSTVRPWNLASLRVLEKTGFRRDHITTDERGDIVWLLRDLGQVASVQDADRRVRP